jgi:hypothetical protein
VENANEFLLLCNFCSICHRIVRWCLQAIMPHLNWPQDTAPELTCSRLIINSFRSNMLIVSGFTTVVIRLRPHYHIKKRMLNIFWSIFNHRNLPRARNKNCFSKVLSKQLIAKTQMVECCWRAGSIRFTIYSVEHFFASQSKNCRGIP